MSSNIIVIAEAREGEVKKASHEAVSAALELAEKTKGEVVVIVPGHDLEAAREALAASGAARVIAIESEALAAYSPDGYCRVIVDALKDLDPAAILMAFTAMGKDLAPRVAAALETGLISDATALHFEDGKFGATKPVYAGKAYCKAFAERAPFMATTRPNNFSATEASGTAAADTVTPTISATDLKAIVTEVIAGATDRVPLQEAQVIVSGGRGLKDPANFHLIEELAGAFGASAAVGASRAVVDAGWRPHREQVGQTGKVVAPTLYIACGISGAIQHLAGMRTSRYIVAINTDPDAPIFKVADYGIVGDALEVLPALTEAVAGVAAS